MHITFQLVMPHKQVLNKNSNAFLGTHPRDVSNNYNNKSK